MGKVAIAVVLRSAASAVAATQGDDILDQALNTPGANYPVLGAPGR